MATLTVWRFDAADAADQAAQRVGDLVLPDAAIVSWPAGAPKPRTRRLADDGLDAGFWGLLLGLVFYVPLLGAAMGAPTGAVAGSLGDVGIDDHFVNRLRDQVTPGTSALFVLASDAVADQAHEALADGPRAEIVHTALDAEQEAALRAVFGD